MMTFRFRGTWRFLGAAAAFAIALAGSGQIKAADLPPGPASVQPQTTIINEELGKAWAAAELKPSKKASDYEFVRRVFIDIVGRIPSAEEARDYAEVDTRPNKKAELVRRLLYSKDYKPKSGSAKEAKSSDYALEYAQNFKNIWGVWLMTRGGVAEAYHENLEVWLEEQFTKNRPWNEIVRDLLTAKGKTNENGASAFMVSHFGEAVNPPEKRKEDGNFDMIPLTSRITKMFLGVQTNCLQCHDHPFNPEWKQDNFWGVNAFLRQTVREGTPVTKEQNTGKKKRDALPVTLTDDPSINSTGRIFFERRTGIMFATKPNFLPNLADLEKEGTPPRKSISSGSPKSRREHLAEYVLAHDNFAKAYVNKMWAHFFGRGMNELPAADDFGGHNKVVHVDMLNKLGEEFVKYGYDTKKLIEWICNSDAYALSYQTNGLADGKGGNAKDEAAPYFTRMALKSMSPEVLFESLETATRIDSIKDEATKKTKKDQWINKLVNSFGDDEGNEVNFNGTIIQALLMMNGDELNFEVSRKDGTGAVDKAMNKYKNGSSYNEMGVINELYLMTLTRKPGTTPTIETYAKNAKTGKDVVDAKGKPVVQSRMSETAFLQAKLVEMKKTGATPAHYKAFFEDVFWSLLNTSEFMLNH